MNHWLANAVVVVAVLLAATGLFFFTVTRGALLVRAARGLQADRAAHVYPIYSNRHLIRLVDFQPVIAAILLFQYDRLVAMITRGIAQSKLGGRDLLITSCAFGNVIPRVVAAADAAQVRRVLIADVVRNELDHARRKLRDARAELVTLEEDATAMSLADASVAVNVVFFLLHELPHPQKAQVLREAIRVLAPGGTLYLAEFHRPHAWVLRALSWTYFKVFEPYGLALWDSHDPLQGLQAMGLECERQTVFFGNFQIVRATKPAAARGISDRR